MDKKLVETLICPKCKSKLEYDKNNKQLICRQDQLVFPVRDGIPVMLEDEALPLNEEAQAE